MSEVSEFVAAMVDKVRKSWGWFLVTRSSACKNRGPFCGQRPPRGLAPTKLR